MYDYTQFYIDGQWVDPVAANTQPVENPATEEAIGHISFGGAADVDRAVKAARKAFESWQFSSREERLELLRAIQAGIEKRREDLARAVSDEMGAPMSLANGPHVGLLAGHCATAIQILEDLRVRAQDGPRCIVYEPIGVFGLITPWNWPLNQIACKVFPALATGSTMVLKPVGDRPVRGRDLRRDAARRRRSQGRLQPRQRRRAGRRHGDRPATPISTWSASPARPAPASRSRQGGRPRSSALRRNWAARAPTSFSTTAPSAQSVAKGTIGNDGQFGPDLHRADPHAGPLPAWTRPTRPRKEAAEKVIPGDPKGNATIGPVVSKAQWDKIQGLIEKGIEEGATLVAGGPGKPEGLETGYYVKPTVFANVTNDMTIAREEIFGPVLAILGYKDLDEAVRSPTTPNTVSPARSPARTWTWPARLLARSAPAGSRSTAATT